MTGPQHDEHPTIEPEDRVDPAEFDDYDEVDSRTVNSEEGAPP